jgi:RNA polymerase sigma-70 factor, ECF subfamily
MLLKAPIPEVEERLLVAAAQKDPSRFAELYDHNFERVYAYVARRIGNRAEAEDITSEVFHQALANLGRYEWRGVPFVAWLLRIAANAVADRWNRAARESGHPPPDRPSHAEVSLEEVADRARLFRLVSTLPVDQKSVIEMRFAQEKSIREIAQAMGRSEGAIKQLQFRALEKLRAQVAAGTTGEAHA